MTKPINQPIDQYLTDCASLEAAPLRCVRCHRPVLKCAQDYELFEKMHWLCFHMEFEHEGDADEACGDPSCPIWHLELFREKLRELGHDPDELIARATWSGDPL